MWNAIQTAKLFGLARETVRKYSIEFQRHLSPQANPGDNRTRVYSESDMEIFALIVEMKAQGKLYSDIHAALMNGQRGELPLEVHSIVTGDNSRFTQLQLRLVFVEDELRQAMLDKQHDRGQIELLKEQIADMQAKMDRLTGENSVLKYRLEETIKPPTS